MKIRNKFFLFFILLGVIILGFVIFKTWFDKQVSPSLIKNQNSVAPKDILDERATLTHGPYTHKVFSASSLDGLNWTVDDGVILEHASVPDVLLRPDGVLEIVYVDATKSPLEQVNCATYSNKEKQWTVKDCQIKGWENFRSVDPSLVQLPDGRYRLYSYVSKGDQEINSQEDHFVRSAISNDGINFVDEGVVFTYPGLVDPDVFWNGKEWEMLIFTLTEKGLIIATSSDGLSFEYKQDFPEKDFIIVQPVVLNDGTFRAYGFDVPDMKIFVSFTSNDGFTWIREEGIRLTANEGKKITDPQAVLLPDGTWKMIFKEEDAGPSATAGKVKK